MCKEMEVLVMNSVVGNTEIEGFPPIDKREPKDVRAYISGSIWISAVDYEDGYDKVHEALKDTGLKIEDIDFDGQLK
jgi:hypothetical protein